MTETAKKSETFMSSNFRGNHFRLLEKLGVKVGDTLESLEANRDGSRDRVKLVRMAGWQGYDLRDDGTMIDPFNPDARQAGWHDGVITHCEYPPGGKACAFALNCRDWQKVA